MKDVFKIPLFATAIVIVLMLVGDSLAQANRRSSRSGSSTRSSQRDGASVRSRNGTNNREALPVKASDEPLSPEAQTAIEELKIIRNKLQANRRQIDKMFREMPIGFASAQMEKQKEIDAAKEEAVLLNSQMIEKGIEIFRLAPLREAASTRIVMQKLSESLSPTAPTSHFDPKMAMEISSLLLDQEDISWQLLMKSFKACYAVQNFEQASMILDRLEEYGPVKDVYYEVLEETSQAWQDELIIRRLETATGDLPYAIVETTEGKFIIELFENQATFTVYDFVSRAESGYYDGLPFHWVRPGEFSRVGWSLQTRAPANDTISSEALKEKARKHFTGSVSMVSNDGQTTSSVFQICHQPILKFNGKHTVFGRIVDFKETAEGETESDSALDIVYRLNTIDGNRFTADLSSASKIIKITIKNKRAHDYNSSVADAQPSGIRPTVIQTGNRGETTTSFDLLPQGGSQN